MHGSKNRPFSSNWPIDCFFPDELFLDDKGEDVEEEEELLADQSYHARQLLRQLDTKITNKTQAMQALRSSHKLEKDKVSNDCMVCSEGSTS